METPSSKDDPQHISQPIGRVFDSLLEPFEGDLPRPVRDRYDGLSAEELGSLLSNLQSRAQDGTATEDDLIAIDDLTIAQRASKNDQENESPEK